MCYEFSGWFKKARATPEARKQEPIAEKALPASPPGADAKPVATPTRVQDHEVTPA